MARLPTPRYRFIFALVVVICILLLWTREWSPEASPDDSYLSRFRQSIELPQGPQVFASEGHKNTVVTLDNVRYRWTTIHANVLPEKDARYLEILAFLEDLSYDGPMSIHHQAIVPSNIAQLVDKATCAFNGTSGDLRTDASLRYEMPHAWYAVLVRCKIPEKVQLPDKASLDLAFRPSSTSVKHIIDLKPYTIEEPSKTSNLAFCLAPAFGDLNLFKILEWRLHHARLGVKTVHWYTRRPNPALQTLIKILNHDKKLSDSWKEATPISPDTFETEHLQEHGLYGDQVLYYIDCLERSKHLHPSHWLAFIDLDEYFLPDPFDLTGIDDFLDFKNHTNVASICVDRNQAERAPDHGSETELLFEHITDLVERKQDHPTDNRKCMYRPGSLLVPFVHWPLLLREGKANQEVVYNTEGEYLRLLHASPKQYWGDKIPLVKTDAYEQHVRLLRSSVNYYLRTYAELFQ